MSTQRLTAVVLTKEDVCAVLSSARRPNLILALAPSQRAVVANCGIPVTDTLAKYDRDAHARTVARVESVLRSFDQAAEEAGFKALAGEAAYSTLRGLLKPLAAASFRMDAIIGDGPWLVRSADRAIVTADRATAIHCLTESMPWVTAFPVPRQSALGPVIAAINQITAAVLRRRGTVIMGGFERGFAHLIDLCDHGKGPAFVLPVQGRGDWRCVARAGRALWHAIAGRHKVIVPVVAVARPDVAEAARSIIARLELHLIAPFFRDHAVACAAGTSGLIPGMTALMGGLRPLRLMSYHMRWLEAAAMAEACGAVRVPRVLISHGSHPVPTDDTSRIALRQNADGILFSRMADEAWVQSPHAEAALKEFPHSNQVRRVRPIVWGYKTPPVPRSTSKRRILQAGTFKSWGSHHAWIYETSEEYLDTLAGLIEAVASLDDAELVIRLRPTPEITVDALRALLPSPPNVLVRSEGEFLDDLAAADLLISDASTTIEEALAQRRPVLLWTASGRYNHLPASSRLPTLASRSAVYAPTGRQQLSGMLRSVLDAHAGRPLTDDEIAAHVWPETVPGPSEIADEIKQMSLRATSRGRLR